ncbi:multidrug effflux MFS transporter [Lysobacter sp. GX 14042]|uniref:multidrug effflux MFS transporter n=1 Tax=Lysobacter sp. GX 14042 TaxID=2907155 RepID=UPI001F2049A9|nr:multidrug effflux MFS transporter [Lysobacter sp. GX 14042]MCE7032533.1 multidrug effflux MFS transporter [Lysobacter sp. GX 14042]
MATSPAPTPSISTRRLALLLAGLSMFGPFAIDTIFPAFPAMGGELGADKLAMQQTISFYLVAYAVMSIVHGPLSDAFGRRRVILGGLSVFTLASVGCALSTELGTLLAFRVLQGLSAGAGLIVGRAVIRDVLEGAAAQRLMSQVSMIFGVAPAIAPIIGGWLIGWSHWTSIFWFLVVFSAVLLLVTWRGLPETLPPAERSSISPRGLWGDYRTIAGNTHFRRLAAAAAFNFGALFLFIASAPAFVLDLLQLRGEPLGEQDFHWFFVPMIAGMMLGAWLSGRMAGRVEPRRQVALGFGVSAVAMAIGLGYNLLVDAPQVPWAVLPVALNAFGIALVFPVVTLLILDLFPRHRGSASSMQAFTTLVLNSVLAGIVSPWLSHSALWLTAAAATLMVLGWAFWTWEIRRAQ